jgi:SAM-dependent methyltransferase
MSDVYHQMIDLCGFHGRVIDFGTGAGNWLPALSERCDSILAIDREQFMLDKTTSNIRPNVQIKRADTLGDLAISSADGIVCSFTLSLFYTAEDWHVFFRDAFHVLKPGGLLLIDVPRPFYVFSMLARLEGLRNIPKNGLRFGLDRQLGWMLIWLRSAFAASLRPKKNYAVRRAVVDAVIKSHGFEISPLSTAVEQLSVRLGYRKHTSWWLLIRPT